ncbi:hypothetical protein [Aquiflexum gelatinilyticum]|uniref:Uncharacterized protein n=1 Tax=Aquiflexum gelatinilyticum TaxID=2961943 RepID=A0A9X2P660_9BACT|nr:hypothetical protein [Aquiflexum gelatinilyticum]MCR9015556.1 hypothetical protein [Aquiflexum gelatinilyticum]
MKTSERGLRSKAGSHPTTDKSKRLTLDLNLDYTGPEKVRFFYIQTLRKRPVRFPKPDRSIQKYHLTHFREPSSHLKADSESQKDDTA